jgi:RNA processing factor Prp31
MSTNDETATRFNNLERKLFDELHNIKKEVDDLYETVYKGNGSPSLVTRINSVEGKLRGLREQMDEKITHLSKENSLKFDSIHQKLESKFGRLEGWIETRFSGMEDLIKNNKEFSNTQVTETWKFRVALVTAVAGILTTIIAYFAK